MIWKMAFYDEAALIANAYLVSSYLNDVQQTSVSNTILVLWCSPHLTFHKGFYVQMKIKKAWKESERKTM